VGAHDGIEANIYDFLGAKFVIWFEVNPLVHPYLVQRLGGRPNHLPFLYGVGDVDEETVPFYFYRDIRDGASGIFLPDKMFDYVKDCPLLDQTSNVTLYKLDTLVARHNLPIERVNFLNVDVQGAELKVFKGAHNLLRSPNLKYILCEVSWDNVYKDAPVMTDIDDFLKPYGFQRIHVRQDWEIHGDALYVRQP